MAKSKYDPNTFPQLAEGYARDGMGDKEIATALGIATGTLYDYKNRFPDFSEALKKGKKPVNFEIENATIKAAKGFYVTETQEEVYKNEEGVVIRTKIKTTRRFIQSDTAAIFMLTNRMPEKYKHRRSHEFDAKGLKVTFDKSDEQL